MPYTCPPFDLHLALIHRSKTLTASQDDYRNVCMTFWQRDNLVCMKEKRLEDRILDLDLVMVRPGGAETRAGAARAELRRLKNVAAAAQGLVGGT